MLDFVFYTNFYSLNKCSWIYEVRLSKSAHTNKADHNGD